RCKWRMSDRMTNALRLAALCVFVAALIVAGARCDEKAPHRDFKPRKPEVKIVSNSPGVGKEAADGRIVELHYTAFLPDGKEVISTRRQGRPDTWRIGDGAVIEGIEEAVKGMRPGGKRTVVIPPE